MKKYHRILLSIGMLLASYLSPVSAQEAGNQIEWTVRFSIIVSWKRGSKKRGGDLGFDVFRLNMLGGYKNICWMQYRLYLLHSSEENMLKAYGWSGIPVWQPASNYLQGWLLYILLCHIQLTAIFNINYCWNWRMAWIWVLNIFIQENTGTWHWLSLKMDVLILAKGAEPSPNRYMLMI